MKNLKKYLHGFTLVELIIVITILAILATIAFVSFQNYTRDARDSNRTTSLKIIDSGLQTFQINTGNYPEPENYVLIQASGTNILYQGYVGDLISKQIKMNKVPLDPLEQSKYIYSSNILKTRYQLLGLLESNNQIAYTSEVLASDLPTRKPRTFGNQLGILLNLDNSSLIGTGIDIVKTNTFYKAIFNNTATGIVTGTGHNLAYFKDGGGGTCREILQNDISKKGKDGFYYINPTRTKSLEVYCDMSYIGEEDDLYGEGKFLNGIGISTEGGSNPTNTIEKLQNPVSDYSLHQTGTGLAEYEIHFKDFSKCKMGDSIILRAWVTDLTGSIFHYRIFYLDGTDNGPQPIGNVLSRQYVGGKNWELQEVKGKIEKVPTAFSWFLGYAAENIKDFYASGIKLYCGPDVQ